jgi:biopolymer transport protein ExbB
MNTSPFFSFPRRAARVTRFQRIAPLALLFIASGADGGGDGLVALEWLAGRLATEILAWYGRTPAPERIAWGGMAAAAVLGLGVLVDRSWRLRRGRVIPRAFLERFMKRLADGQIDRGKGLDYCELNPSPAARVALAAIQRWGRPVAELERAATLARRRESDELRRNVGTLRRIAALAPLVGLFGSLAAAGRILRAGMPAASVLPALADALGPLTAGVALAILALVAYDGLAGRIDALSAALDHIGAETIDVVGSRDLTPLRPDRATASRSRHAAYAQPARARDEP